MHNILRPISAIFLALILFISACTAVATPGPGPSIPGLVNTLAAQTLTAGDVFSQAKAPAQGSASGQNALVAYDYLPTAPAEFAATPLPSRTPYAVMPKSNYTNENSCTNQAEFVGDVSVPDDTRMKGGDRFVKTWRFKNAGTCTWTPDYRIVFVWGELMAGMDGKTIGVTVKPGETVDISIQLVAPKMPNSYTGNWMFEDPGGNRFGTGYGGRRFFWVTIDVGGGGNYAGGCFVGKIGGKSG